MIDQDQEAEGVCQKDLDRLDCTLKETSTLLGKAQEAQKVREKLEQDRKEREMLALQMEVAQKALEAEQEKVPRQESLRKELAALEAELPRAVRRKNAAGEERRVGAALPESVWRSYARYLHVETSPAGVSFPADGRR